MSAKTLLLNVGWWGRGGGGECDESETEGLFPGAYSQYRISTGISLFTENPLKYIVL